MRNHQIDIILKYMRTSLYSLFFMLFCLGAYFLYLTTQSFNHLNANSAESSRIVANSVFENESENLGKVVYDYSFWNETAEALSGLSDSQFYEENLYGDYLLNTFSVDQVVVYRKDGTVDESINKGIREDSVKPVYTEQAFMSLFERAIKTNYTLPEPVITFINLSGQLHFVAASAIVANTETELLSLGQLYGVLVMTKPVDNHLLAKWEKQFHLHDLTIQPPNASINEEHISKLIRDINGNIIAQVAWKPDLPGKVYLGEIMPVTSLIIVFLAIISVVFCIHINKYIRYTLAAAKQLEKNRDELHQLAHYDSVTKLPNRILGMDRLEQALRASDRHNSYTALLFIDLDGFKNVNDTYGHDIGDELLFEVGSRLASCVRDGIDTVSRLGGDEFTVTITNIQNKEEVYQVAEDILELIQENMCIREFNIAISASIGVAVSKMNRLDAEQMIKQADMAMYKAKLAGKSQFIIADDESLSSAM